MRAKIYYDLILTKAIRRLASPLTAMNNVTCNCQDRAYSATQDPAKPLFPCPPSSSAYNAAHVITLIPPRRAAAESKLDERLHSESSCSRESPPASRLGRSILTLLRICDSVYRRSRRTTRYRILQVVQFQRRQLILIQRQSNHPRGQKVIITQQFLSQPILWI